MPQPPADCEGNPPSNPHCGACKYCTLGPFGEARESNYATHSGEHSRDGGQNLWVLGDQVVHRAMQREGCVCHTRGGCAPVMTRDLKVVTRNAYLRWAWLRGQLAMVYCWLLVRSPRRNDAKELSTVACSGSISSLLAENVPYDMKSLESSKTVIPFVGGISGG